MLYAETNREEDALKNITQESDRNGPEVIEIPGKKEDMDTPRTHVSTITYVTSKP